MRSISLFSGCGGLDLGLHRAGFAPVFAADNDPHCRASFESNFPDVPFFADSAARITPEVISNHLGACGPGEIELLAGGPPCPPFSKSRYYRKDKPRGLEDSVGNATINAYLDVLTAVRPKAFLLENVAGLAYRTNQSALDLIINRAEALGYSVSRQLLNAADFGVPQIRQRYFVVGIIGKNFVFPTPTHSEDPSSSEAKSELRPWVTSGDVLADLDTEDNASHEGHFAGGRHHELLCQVPPGDNYLFFTKKRGHPNPQFEWRSRYWSFLLKLSPELPSWTIQATRSSNMGPFHWRNRILRIEEIKRIQTFPDGWALAGNVQQQWRQVGNAVPPTLALALGQALKEQLSL